MAHRACDSPCNGEALLPGGPIRSEPVGMPILAEHICSSLLVNIASQSQSRKDRKKEAVSRFTCWATADERKDITSEQRRAHSACVRATHLPPVEESHCLGPAPSPAASPSRFLNEERQQ